MKRTAIVYWLIPAEPYRELFREIVRILAKQLDAPRFEPHLTLLATSRVNQSPKEVLRQTSGAPIRLRIRDVSFSTKFTRTLFVRFKSSAALKKLVVDLARVTKSRAESMSDPHVSLLYKKVSTVTKKELASTIKLPFREVVFDSVVALRCVLPVRNRASVEAWRILATKRLAG